jgi:peptidoglycan biosynthesis protein MviN/MurJ (putative lipid II flippase)
VATRAQPRTTIFVGSVNLIAQVADKLFSFGQIVVIAASLGASPAADLLFLASIVPLTVGYVVGEPVGRAFLTLLVRETDEEQSRRLAASAFVLTVVALIVIAGAYALLASVLVTLFTPGGSGSLGPWLTLSAIAPCAGIAGLLSGILLWLHDYTWAAARMPIASAFGLVLVLVAASTSGRLVWIAAALSASYGFSAVVTYLRVARALGPRWAVAITRADLLSASRVRRLVLGPTVGGAIGGQVIVAIERLLAGAIVGTGAVSIISYARGIATAPTVLAQAVGASSYPRVVRAEAEGQHDFLRESLVRGLRLSLFFGLSCMAFLVLFGPAAVSAVLERGKFTVAAANQTGHVLIAFSVATFSGSLIAYLIPFIYGLNRFRSIIKVELAIFIAYLLVAPIVVSAEGLPGLAAAFAIAQSCGVVVALNLCRRAIGVTWRRLARRTIMPAFIPMAVVVVVEIAYRLLVDSVPPPIAYRGIVRAGGGGLVLTVAMAFVLLVSPLPESEQLRQALRRKFGHSVQ